MRALLARYLDRAALPDVRPDEMFFMAGPTPSPKSLVTAPEVRVKRSHRRVLLSRHGHPSV
jgi:hypothetical protein